MTRLHRGFQVKQYKPWKLWLGLVFLLLLMIALFQLGKRFQAYELEYLKLERETLVSQIEDLKTRNLSLVQKNAHLQGGSKIERDAYEIANQNLVKLQRELLAQKEELAFYQGIVAPNDAELGVNLQTFEIRKKNNQSHYSFKMILTKNGKSTKKIQGAANVLIRGESGGNVSELKMSELGLDKQANDTKFAFRYFQVFEGDISLPEGFEPFEVEIGINPSTRKVKSFTETISWAELMSEGI